MKETITARDTSTRDLEKTFLNRVVRKNDTLQSILDTLERIETILTTEVRILYVSLGMQDPFQLKSEENSTDSHVE